MRAGSRRARHNSLPIPVTCPRAGESQVELAVHEARKRLVACRAPSQVSRDSWWGCSQHRTRGSCSSPP